MTKPKTAQAGDNSKAKAGGIDGDQLRTYIERIERLNEDKAAIGDDIKAVFAEAKAGGYDPKVMRKVIKLRGMDRESRLELETTLELYKRALDMD